MIKFATDNMLPELKALWLEGFEGDDEYSEFYFNNYFTCKNCVVHTNDRDEVEAAVYIYRGETMIRGKRQPVLFLYAVATFAKYRNQGKFTAICNFLADYCRENQIGLIALSTTAPSVSPCEKLGMVPKIQMGATSLMVDSVTASYPCAECGYDEFAAMRKAYLNRDFEIYWTEETNRYMHAEMQTSGDVVKTVINGNTYYAAFTRMDDELLIRETNCPVEYMSALLDSVCSYENYRGMVTVYTKADTVLKLDNTISQEVFCYAHIWFVDESLDLPDAKWYINLTAE